MTDPILTPERQGLVERMAALGPTIAQRSEDYDRDARFPYENWADFRDAGLLGICIPVEDGGLGGDFVGYEILNFYTRGFHVRFECHEGFG